jgi:hypothetical protein
MEKVEIEPVDELLAEMDRLVKEAEAEETDE